ncbi:flagellar biosynthetic protein FliR [Roseomonas sp. SSH11]|uniref:Flagellar biosynthetic protein FliR n=1 Tax=Pararoseomonas baculiformis TaxID=2820812 RepID=A0ABS4AGS9_9PROT|nr:flagellar biosynthetic protein FliR [Pararoseomonas baculiformis]MBP0446232.1 flagellar biosynthetic protein FliR [Pararoseomonas baculiformis]
MSEAMLLQALPDLAFGAVLLLARLGAAAMILPGLGEGDVPASVRLGFALALVPLLLPLLAPGLPATPDMPAEALWLLALEVLTGLWIGGLARLLALSLSVALQAAALLLGLSALLVPDAQLGGGASALGRLGTLAAAVLILSTGLHGLPLRALAESYALMPPGAPWPAGDAASEIAASGAAMLALALRLAAPFIIAAVTINLAMALIARVAPSVQVFFIAAPGQILAGLALLALLGPAILASFHQTLQAGWSNLPGLR